MSDDQDIERLAAEVRYLNAQYDQAMAKRRLQEARRPAWKPPAEFINMMVLVLGVSAAVVILFALLSGLDPPRCSAPRQKLETTENIQGPYRDFAPIRLREVETASLSIETRSTCSCAASDDLASK